MTCIEMKRNSQAKLYMRMCIRKKMSSQAVMRVPHDSLLGSSLSDADLLKVAVTKVLQAALDVRSHYVKFLLSGTNFDMSNVQRNLVL